MRYLYRRGRGARRRVVPAGAKGECPLAGRAIPSSLPLRYPESMRNGNPAVTYRYEHYDPTR